MGSGAVKPTELQAACYHCGLDCSSDPVPFQGKFFCCSGCVTVYQILSENGLTAYYRSDESPGVRPGASADDDTFAYLDNDIILEQLVDYVDDKQCSLRLTVPSIHCASCIWLLENLYRLHPGIVSSRVDFVRKQFAVTLDRELISVRGAVELLTRIGYEPAVNLQGKSEELDRRKRRRLYQQVGMAGFCYANIMLFSFPEYLAAGRLSETTLTMLFGYASALLSLPVFFYSARDYLASALALLKHRTLGIDVPIALGMVALFVQSWFEIITRSGPGYFDSLAGLTFFLLLGKLFQQKTYDRLSFDRDYTAYFPLSVQRRANGRLEVTPIGQVQVGDQLVIRSNEIIPADSILTAGEACIDYSFVTGESEPKLVPAGRRIYAGGRQAGGSIEVTVSRPVSQSQLAGLWNNADGTAGKRPAITRTADKVAGYFTAAVLVVAVVTALYWLVADLSVAVRAVTAVLIVACPCALALSSPFALGTAARIIGKAGLFLKSPAVVEDLAEVNTIVFDKTGTLAYRGEREVSYAGDRLSELERSWIASLVRESTHPVSRTLSRHLGEGTSDVQQFTEVAGSGIGGDADGHVIRIGKREWVSGEDAHDDQVSSEHGTWVSIDGELRGAFETRDILREGISEDVSRLSARFQLAVLTGDTDRERPALEQVFGSNTQLKFNQLPEDKRDEVERLTASGCCVLMIGDGLNDAGALASANVGIAVSDNLAAFTPASDGIMVANCLSGLSRFLRLARQTLGVIRLCYALSIAYNLIGLGFAVSGQLSPVIASILMPLSSITIAMVAALATRMQASRAGIDTRTHESIKGAAAWM